VKTFFGRTNQKIMSWRNDISKKNIRLLKRIDLDADEFKLICNKRVKETPGSNGDN